jgi:hypothetical protein
MAADNDDVSLGEVVDSILVLHRRVSANHHDPVLSAKF